MKKVGTDIWFDKLLKKFRSVKSAGNLSGVSVFNRPSLTFTATLIDILQANANRFKKYLYHVSEAELLSADVFNKSYYKNLLAVTGRVESRLPISIEAYLQNTVKEPFTISFSGFNIISIKNQHML